MTYSKLTYCLMAYKHFHSNYAILFLETSRYWTLWLESYWIFWRWEFEKYRKDSKFDTMNVCLKWSFTHKQHAWEPPLNHSWKFDLWPLQTGILKINAGFAEKSRKKWKKSLGRRQNRVLVILVWGFWAISPIFRPNFGRLI